jgi:hypothetical protein
MNSPDLVITERDDLLPKCPHCEAELHEVYIRKQGIGIVFARSSILFCPACRKVLGFGESRMM